MGARGGFWAKFRFLAIFVFFLLTKELSHFRLFLIENFVCSKILFVRFSVIERNNNYGEAESYD